MGGGGGVGRGWFCAATDGVVVATSVKKASAVASATREERDVNATGKAAGGGERDGGGYRLF